MSEPTEVKPEYPKPLFKAVEGQHQAVTVNDKAEEKSQRSKGFKTAEEVFK